MAPDEHDLDEEIRGHLAIDLKQRIERGEDPASARFGALKEFGNVTLARDAMRRVWRPRWFDAAEALVRDMRFAWRSLLRVKGLAATIVVTLALGIGANAAIFSVVRGVLLRPLVNRDEAEMTLKVAVAATIASLPFGILVSYALARWRFHGKIILNAAVHLPLVMPPVVTGFLLLILFGRKGVFGAVLANVGIVLSFRWTGAAVACAVMGFPLMVRAMRLSFESIDRRLEQAAGTLGANRMWTFFLVSLPLALPGIIAGAILAFARALGEFGATITFVANIPGETQTIASAIYSYTQVPGGDANAMRLTVVSIAISFAALVTSEIVQRRAEKILANLE